MAEIRFTGGRERDGCFADELRAMKITLTLKVDRSGGGGRRKSGSNVATVDIRAESMIRVNESCNRHISRRECRADSPRTQQAQLVMSLR